MRVSRVSREIIERWLGQVGSECRISKLKDARVNKGDRGKFFLVDISNLVCENHILSCVGPQVSGAKYCKSKNGDKS